MIKQIAAVFAIAIALFAAAGCHSDSSTTRPARDKGTAADQHMRQFGLYD